jgi:hypothetical protein
MIFSIYGLYPSYLIIIHSSNCDNRAIPHLLSISYINSRKQNLPIHPSIYPPLLMSSSNLTPLVLLFSLADNGQRSHQVLEHNICYWAKIVRKDCTLAPLVFILGKDFPLRTTLAPLVFPYVKIAQRLYARTKCYHSTLTLTLNTKLPDWYGDVCSQARNLCALPQDGY